MKAIFDYSFYLSLLLIFCLNLFAQSLPCYYGFWLVCDPIVCNKCKSRKSCVVWEPPIDHTSHSCADYDFVALQEEFYEGDTFTFKLYKPDGTLHGQGSFMLIWDPIYFRLDCEIIESDLYFVSAWWSPDGGDGYGEEVLARIVIDVSGMNPLGTWVMEVYYNDELVWYDEVDVIKSELPTRTYFFESLDQVWATMTLDQRKRVVKSLWSFNCFTGRYAWLTDAQVRNLIEEVKASNPSYKEIPTDLVLSMVWIESQLNPFAIGSAGELGLGQEKIYNVSTNAYEAYKELRKSNLTDADFDNFKYNKIGLDNRSDPKEAIKTMLQHIYELTKLSYIGNDPAKIVAGYNWGQGKLKDYLDKLKEKKIDESKWIENLDNKKYVTRPNSTTKRYIERVKFFLENCQ